MENYQDIFLTIHEEKKEYFKRWYHEVPFVISKERNEEFQRFGNIMYRCIMKFVECYKEYSNILPLSEKTMQVIKLCEKKEYIPRTFRPDILLCEDNTWKACEITSRFCFSGYLSSWFTAYEGGLMAEKSGITDVQDYFTSMFEYLVKIARDVKRIVVLKSADKQEALNLYRPFFEALGKEVIIVPFGDILNNIHLLKGNLIINELNQIDLLSLDMEVIEKILESNYIQDFRSALFPHDKRFFAVLQEDRFTKTVLTDEETEFLRNHLVKTYCYNQDLDIWKDAKKNKDRYILKHANLGKSEKVFAGCTITQNKWIEIFNSESLENMILQPFQKQRVFKTYWEGKEYLEYAVGTLLLIDDKYYGPGLIRGSSFPVTNQGDDRKFIPIVTNEMEKLEDYFLL